MVVSKQFVVSHVEVSKMKIPISMIYLKEKHVAVSMCETESLVHWGSKTRWVDGVDLADIVRYRVL